MENTRPYWKVIVSLIFSILATLLVVGVGVGLIRYLMPFVIGWLISCIANPVVCWLENKVKIKKKLGSAIMIVLVLGAVIGILYLAVSALVRELGGWIVSLPEVFAGMSSQLNEISDNLTGLYKMLPKWVQNNGPAIVDGFKSAVGDWVAKISEPTVSMAGNLAKQIPLVIIGTFVTILSAYFFVADRDSVMGWAKKVVPKAVYERVAMGVYGFKHAVGGYFMAQFKIMLIVCVILFVGLSLLKVEYAFVLSFLIGFLDFLPFFGTGTAFIPWCIYSILTGNYMRALFLAIIYVITQVVHQFLQPKMIGDEVGLKPLPTLLFIYIGYLLGGVIWMILAVPLGLILINMYKAGAFNYILDDVKILVQGILSLREK